MPKRHKYYIIQNKVLVINNFKWLSKLKFSIAD